MSKKILAVSVMLSIGINVAFCQSYEILRLSQPQQITVELSKEEKDLQKELNVLTKQNKNKFEENLQELINRGYKLYAWDGVTNNNLKMLLAIDDRLIVIQSKMDSTIRSLKNYNFLDSANNDYNTIKIEGSTFNVSKLDKSFLGIHKELIGRLKKFRKQYSEYNRPGSIETNNWYIQQLLLLIKSNDEKNLKTIEQGLANVKTEYEQYLVRIAEKKRKEEEYERKRNEELLAEQNRMRIEKEKIEEKEREREKAIALLPSKAEIRAKFANYKHKTGYVFELFPVGFTPKQNKSTYDRVKILGRIYTARYREYNDYGINSLVIEFYDSGKISNVVVFNGGDPIYSADYNDGAVKPYQIMTNTVDGKFSLIFKRFFNYDTNKMSESWSYIYLPLAYYYPQDEQ